MNEFLQIETGKLVHFDYDLSFSGIHVKVLTDLTEEEKAMFKKLICDKRDVVTIYYKDGEHVKGNW